MGSSEVEARLSGEGDDDSEAEHVTARARLRIAELLERPFDIRSLALTGLFILAVFYTIYYLRSVLLPIVLALLLSYLLRPIVRGLARIKIPTLLGAALILITLLSAITLGISALATPAAGWLAKAPDGLRELEYKLLPMKRSMAEVAKASGEIEKIATPDSGSKMAVEVKRHPITETLYVRTPEFVTSSVLLLILLSSCLDRAGDRVTGVTVFVYSYDNQLLPGPRGGHDCRLARPSQSGDVGRIGRNFKFCAVPRCAYRHYLHDHRCCFKLRQPWLRAHLPRRLSRLRYARR